MTTPDPTIITTSEEITHSQVVLDAERAKWLTITETAYVLRTSKNTILAMMQSGSLSVRREGKVVRIHLESLKPTPQEVPHAKSSPFPLALSGPAAVRATRRMIQASYPQGKMVSLTQPRKDR